MINRLLTITMLLVLAASLVGCGGGTGSSSTPQGVDPGLPSIVKLMPTKQVAQTNSTIALTTKVIDGNGEPVPNVEVIYTNLSTVGVLSGTKALTNSMGQAAVTIFSSDVGFATIQVEVSKGTQWVRDRKVVFYSPFDLTLPTGVSTVLPTLTLDVDSNANGIYNESADFILLHGANNDQAVIRATVKDSAGNLVAGDTVTFTDDSTEATFPLGNTATTGPDGQPNHGQASVIMKVSPSILRSVTTILTVSAVSLTTGAANLVSFFLDPVTVGSVTVTANPTTVESGGSSEITAVVMTSAGTPVPNGTTVNFTANKGAIEPFSQTTDGVASVQWTAPTVTSNTTATVTASSGGKSGTTSISITAPVLPLQVVPATRSFISGATAQTATFTVSGGTGPYTAVSNDPSRVTVSGTTATVLANACPGNVTITFYDSVGASVTATVTIVAPAPFTVAPTAVTCNTGTCGGTVMVSGGILPYSTISSNPAVIATPTAPLTSGGTFTVTQVAPVLVANQVTITVGDACANTRPVAVTVNP